MQRLRIKSILFRAAFFLGKIVLLLSMLLLGLIAERLWSEISPPTVTMCQLAQHPDWYRWRMVRVEANADGGFGTVIIGDESCHSPDAWAGIWHADGYQPEPEVQKLFSESETETFKARVIVTGRFNPNAGPGCFGPKAAIKPTKIELKSEIVAMPRKIPENKITDQDMAARKFFGDFQKAVAGDNKKQMASMIQYPLRVIFYTDPRDTDYHVIEKPAEFLKVYDRIFAHSVRDYIAKFNADKVWGNDYFMQTDSGQIGIAVSCQDNQRGCKYDFKIKVIYSNNIEIDYNAAKCGPTIDCYMQAVGRQSNKQ